MAKHVMITEEFKEIDVSAAWKDIMEAGYERRVQALALVDVDDWQVASQFGKKKRGSRPPLQRVSATPASR